MIVLVAMACALSNCSHAAIASTVSAQTVHVRRGPVTIDARISRRPVVMAAPLAREWDRNAAPVVVRITGSAPDVTVWATPSYGLETVPGRHVHGTYLLKYRALGDHADAQPGYAGLPLRPNPGKRDGWVVLSLPLAAGLALRVRLDVVGGRGTTSLANPAHPERNIVSAR